jgi:membrane-associated phospholipid phosphatase
MMQRKKVRGGLVVLLAAAVGLLALTLADHWIWEHMRVGDKQAVAALETKDWYRALRELGYWPVWIVVGVVIMLADMRPSAGMHRGKLLSRGMLVVMASGFGGAAAELLKAATHRFRPGETGEYMFSWMVNGDRGPGFGLASSHAGVAFGAAFMLARLFPRVGPVVILLAVGCGVTRLLAGAHFATDVYVAACMSYGVAAGLWRVSGRGADGAHATDGTDGAGSGAGRPSDFE